MDRKILGEYDAACLLTLMGGVMAVHAMLFAVQGITELALIGLMIAGVADMFDGVVARRMERSPFAREYGVQLDTTVDVVAFIAAPVVIALHAGLDSLPGMVAVVCFVVAGVVRLAHFNALSVMGADQSSHHRGLPVTYTALIFPLLFLLRDSLGNEAMSNLLGATFAVLSLLFVINVPVPKPRGVMYLVLPLLAVVLIAYWLWHYLQAPVTG